MELHDLVSYLEGKYGITLYMDREGDSLILSSIKVPNNERGIGIGSKVMEEISDYADKVEMNVYLTPSIGLGATSVSRLKKFYKRFGFQNKPRNDFSQRQSMIRYPKGI